MCTAVLRESSLAKLPEFSNRIDFRLCREGPANCQIELSARLIEPAIVPTSPTAIEKDHTLLRFVI